MGTFYDKWLRYWEEEQEERARARKIIHEEDLEWVRTKQDYRAALLCSKENGFVTAGNVLLGEIPKGWHSGSHSHGEEAIFIVDGEGFSVIDGYRYDWDAGSCLFIPFGAIHQHFNSGEKTVRYLSAMALALERFAGLAKVMQYEEAGETYLGMLEGSEPAESDIHPQFGRIVLKSRDTQVISGEEATRQRAGSKEEFEATMPKEMNMPGQPPHSAKQITLMSSENGFKAREVNLTAVFLNEPGERTGKHAHMEAQLYVLEGEGYSILDGEK
ncbi:MAG: cupin domain-containing protein, partial [Dehalococcoidia bacterium]|nr:cupin domain-containing protein [Dehalococcoidia bacterium]